MVEGNGGGTPQSQTLDRGLRILEHLAAVGSPQPIADIGSALGLHRSITYRLLRTLEDHHLVTNATGPSPVSRIARRSLSASSGLGGSAGGAAGGVRAGGAGPCRAPARLLNLRH